MFTRASLKAFSTEALKVFNNVARQQFIVSLKGEATISYETSGKSITFISTNVPPEFQGKGVGKLLAEHAFNHAQYNKLDVLVRCHFLAKYYQDNLNKYKSLKVKFDLD